jgi:hypothetical protein
LKGEEMIEGREEEGRGIDRMKREELEDRVLRKWEEEKDAIFEGRDRTKDKNKEKEVFEEKWMKKVSSFISFISFILKFNKSK